MHFIVGNRLLEDVMEKLEASNTLKLYGVCFYAYKRLEYFKIELLFWVSGHQKQKKLAKLNKQSLKFQHHHVAQSL